MHPHRGRQHARALESPQPFAWVIDSIMVRPISIALLRQPFTFPLFPSPCPTTL